MKNKRYNLLTTLIVSALHPNEPFGAGTKWEPSNTIDIKEADELVGLNYAEEWAPRKEDELTLTLLQKQDQASKQAAADDGFEPGGDDDLDGDDDLLAILSGGVEAVAGELEGLDEVQLRRLEILEGKGKQRKGVADAINDALEALEDGDDHGDEDEDDADLASILEGGVELVIAELDGLDVQQLTRLAELEEAGKARKGVAEAINSALAALQPE